MPTVRTGALPRVVGWVQQISDDQFMAIRSPDLGGATTYHKTFGLAKTAVEQSVSHSTTAVKSDTAVPFRWTLYDRAPDPLPS